MRATIAIDDELFATAQKFAGVTGKSAVITAALKAFIEREAGRGSPQWEGRNLMPRFRRGGDFESSSRST